MACSEMYVDSRVEFYGNTIDILQIKTKGCKTVP